jgi:hypothetical protein
MQGASFFAEKSSEKVKKMASEYNNRFFGQAA